MAGDLACHARAPHPAHVGDERDQRHHPGGRDRSGGERGAGPGQPPGSRRRVPGRHQRGGRLPRDAPHAEALPPQVIALAYLVAAILFILSLKGLSTPATAKRGNWYGIVGMVLAVGATVAWP